VRIEPARPEDFVELATWRYETPYDFYNGDQDPVKNPERFFIARDDAGEVVGFYYFEPKDDALEYGLGLRPELTGRGLEFGRKRYMPPHVRLFVAAFNARAIKVYERAGFRETGRHTRTFARWGDVEFVNMEEQR
jgi:RimJ/RimL family protein N-acetyltransferase